MKTHVLLALVGLVTGFVVPAFTQEKEEVHPFLFGAIQAKPEIVQQLEAIGSSLRLQKRTKERWRPSHNWL